ncbi:MAG: energy-coupling factor ABC transporter permease [Methanothrix sp.]
MPINSSAGAQRLHHREESLRRAIAGYIALSLAAFCTGVEFGLQPILNHTPGGVPLYMPYPLSVTVPAMVLEHVLGFSILEALITALIFSYVQKTDTSTLYGEESRSLKKKPNAAATA